MRVVFMGTPQFAVPSLLRLPPLTMSSRSTRGRTLSRVAAR